MKLRDITITSLALLVAIACSSSKKSKFRGGSDEADGTPEQKSATEEPNNSGDPIAEETNTPPGEDGKVAPPAPGTPPGLPPGTTLVDVPVGVGIRNFDQINLTLSALTGVPSTDAAVVLSFAREKGNLPTNNDIKGISPAQISSATKLAATYCNALISNVAYATQKTAIFGAFDFASLPTAVGANTALINGMLDKFWGTGLDSSLGNRADYVKIVGDLLNGLGGQTPAPTTPGVVVGACASILASAPVLLY